MRYLRSLPVPWGGAAVLALAVGLLGWLVLGRTIPGQDYFQVSRVFPVSYWFFARLGLPLHWYPYMEGGVPASYLTQAQPFHLPAWLLTWAPSYWGSGLLTLRGAKVVLLFALAHGFSYSALRRLAPEMRPSSALAATFALTYGLRSLDAVRFGAYWDAMAYAQCLSVAFLWYLAEGKTWLYVAMAALTQLLFTAGYPTLIAFTAVFLLLGGPAFVVACGLDKRLAFRRAAWASTAAAIGLGLSAPHWLFYFDFLEVNEARSLGATLGWAAQFPMRLPHQLFANLVAPWAAEVHCAFGGSALLSLMLLEGIGFAVMTLRRNGPWLVLALGLVLYAAGPLTPVHAFFFHYVPGFRFFRVPGRFFSLLPALGFVGLVAVSRQRRECARVDRFARLLAAGVVGGLAVWVTVSGVDGAWKVLYRVESVDRSWSSTVKALWFATTLASAGLWLARHHARWTRVLLGGLAVLQTGWLMRHGTWTRPRPAQQGSFEELLHSASFLPLTGPGSFLRVHGLWSAGGAATRPMTQFVAYSGEATRCVLPFEREVGRRSAVGGVELPWYLSPAGCVTDWGGDRLSAVGGCGDPPIRARTNGAICAAVGGASLADLNAGNRLLTVSPNGMRLETAAPAAALLVSPYPNVPNWSVFLDGRPVRAIEINGGLLGLEVPPGKHEVKLAYFSERRALGDFVFWLTLLALGILALERSGWTARSRIHRHLGRGVALAVVLAALAGYPAYLVSARRKAEADFGLGHDYADRLARQLTIWRTHPRGWNGLAVAP